MKDGLHCMLIRLGGVAGLLALFAQLALAAPQLTLTYDEPIYTAIGYADLTTGDFYWHGVIGHGPLINILSAWPLLLGRFRPDVTQLPEWGGHASLSFARETLAALGPLEISAFVTRIPVMWLTVLLAALVARWAAQAWGRSAGLAAVWLFAFEPNLIAHGHLNTTDMGVTAFGFAGAYFLARYLRRRTPGAYVGAGLALGAALASKTSGFFWIGAYGLIVLSFVAGLPFRGTLRAYLCDLGHWLARLAGMLVIGLLVLWACYGFEVKPLVDGGLPIPAASHWQGLVYQQVNITAGQLTFLAGRLHPGGHWTYFPLTLLLKTPLLLLLGLGLAVWSNLRGNAGPHWSTAALFVPPSAYMLVSMLAGLNIGHRHLLPIVPFMVVIVARLTPITLRLLRNGALWQRAGLSLLAIGHILSCSGVFPHYLAYFNLLAGGANGGYRYLADSSVDWGQSLHALKTYLDAQEAARSTPIRLSAFSSLDPAWYGLDFTPLPPTERAPITLTARFNPEPGRYVISVTPLQGIWLLDPDTYDWFRHRTPDATVGYTLFVYDVLPDPTPRQRVLQCAAPLPVLDATAITEGFGRADLRSDAFDCHHSWLYPGDGAWVVLPDGDDRDTWSKARLAGMPLQYQQHEHWSHPALRIYTSQTPSPGAVAPEITAHLAPSTWPPAQALQEGSVVAAPVNIEETLAFLGYALRRDKTGMDLDTYWRVEQQPQRAFSIMAHLLAANGAPVAIGDGLGVPREAMVPGDVFVQRHRLDYPTPAPVGPYYVQTGVYWLDTLERWPVVWTEPPGGDRLVLPASLP